MTKVASAYIGVTTATSSHQKTRPKRNSRFPFLASFRHLQFCVFRFREACTSPSSRLAFLRAFFFRYLYFLPLGDFLHFLFFRSSEPWPRQPRCGFRSFFFASVTLNGTAKHQLNTWSARRKHSHIAKITTKPDQGVVKDREPLESFPSFRHIGEG